MNKLKDFFFNGHLFTLVVGIVFTIPILFLLFSLDSIKPDLWQHLLDYVLPEVAITTLSLVVLVTSLSLVLGSTLAYINTFYDYSGRNFFKIFNILPMSFPPYILAFIYIALFDVTGIFSLAIKNYFQLSFFFPSIRNLYGLAFVLTLCLTPYVYLMATQSFRTVGALSFELGTSMGFSKKKIFFKLLFPLSAPTLMSSLIIVSMEVLADFGTVALFNVSTFSTAIYRSWFGLQSIDSAKQISLILIAVVLILMSLNWFILRQKSTVLMTKQLKKVEREKLKGIQNLMAIFFQSLHAIFSFILPILILAFWSYQSWDKEFDSRYFSYITYSLKFALYTIFVLIILSTFIALSERKDKNGWSTFFKNAASVGYAFPGAVLSVSLFVMLTKIESSFFNDHRLLTTTIFGLILGLSIRFFSVSFTPIEQSLNGLLDSHLQYLKITPIPFLKKITTIYLPILQPGLMTATLFVSVEVIKEIPMTLMMRPFGHESLAIRIFELTSEGEWQRAALPSMILITICLISTSLIIFREEKNESK